MRETRSNFMLAMLRTLVVLLLTLTIPSLPSGAASSDVVITDRDYLRHDGGSDAAIFRCGSDATTPGPGGDFGGNRQANEPAVAINPSNPKVIVAGANDYCTVATFNDAWMGFYVSQDGGRRWINSLNPGYPADTSTEGKASSIFRRAFSSGDPIMDWDNDNRLFYGGIAFNRTDPNESGLVTPTNGDVIVSTWQYDPSQPLGMNYLRTVIVGTGTPSAFFFGRFNDKPSLKVDDWVATDSQPASPHLGKVYVSWTLFPGAGQDQILFSRSTDHGQTFSKPIKISRDVASAQGSDIAVAPNGHVYVFWREFAHPAAGVEDAIVFTKSTDGGVTFGAPRKITPTFAQRSRLPYDRADRYGAPQLSHARDCGDGDFHCLSEFVFHRVATLPQAVADSAGKIYVTWEEVVPAVDDDNTYRPDGQAQVVWTRSIDGGENWDPPDPVDLQSNGHQWWPNIEYDKSTNTLALIYYDSREDDFFDLWRPPGNRLNGTSSCGVPAPRRCDVLNTFIATATAVPTIVWQPAKVSTMGHQPEYELFGNRNVPFHGDYLWVDAVGGVIFGVWTDNRDVVPGDDPRESPQDGFDVKQCRQLQPDGTFGADTCPNAGGLNQNIYGARLR